MQTHFLLPDELRLLKAVKHCNDQLAVPCALTTRHVGLPILERHGLIVCENAGPYAVFATITVKGITTLHEHEEDIA